MASYHSHYRQGGRISVYSVTLLFIFLSAAAVVLAAIVWRPWFDESSAATLPAPQPAAGFADFELEAPAEDAESDADGESDGDDGGDGAEEGDADHGD
jgi:hypothetical protein